MDILYKGYVISGTPQEITEFLQLNTETVVTTDTKIELISGFGKTISGVYDPLEDPLVKERRYMEDNGKKFLNKEK